jgi:hypothetical protein
MNERQRNAKNAQIWGKQNDSNYDGNCTSHHYQSATYKISGRLINVEQSVQNTKQISKSAGKDYGILSNKSSSSQQLHQGLKTQFFTDYYSNY